MTKIQLRRDTAANWSTNNPTPSAGEPCFEIDTHKFKIGDGVTKYTNLPYQGSDGLEICDIGIALYVDETKGLRRYLNGQVIDINTNTQAFLNRLKEITTLHPSLLCTEEEWQTAKTMSAFGQVGKFVFNYSGDEIVSVRIPAIVNAQGLFDLQNLGMTVSESLPNITGYGGLIMYAGYGTGVFSGSSNTTALPGGQGAEAGGLNFNASRSSSTYKDNAPVQPEAIQYPYFIQIATGSETENNIINEIELNNPYSLFDSKYSDHELNNLSWLKSEGQWNAKAVYPTAYDELLIEYNNSASVNKTEGSITFKRTPKGYKIALADQETAIDTKYSTDGIAWYYILDTANEKFKLPRTKFGFEGLRTSVGDDIKAGLPNITGTVGIQNLDSTGFDGHSGCCTYDKTSGYASQAGAGTTTHNLKVDASRSSSIYGNSDTVQPPATQMYLYFYVGETVQNANLIDAGRIGEQLAGKVDLDAQNLSANGKSLISGLGMLSSKYIDLTLGASGTKYTAPADGWVLLTVQPNPAGKACVCDVEQGSLAVYNCNNGPSNVGADWFSVLAPVKKGTFKVEYRNATKVFFSFFYTIGSSPTV